MTHTNVCNHSFVLPGGGLCLWSVNSSVLRETGATSLVGGQCHERSYSLQLCNKGKNASEIGLQVDRERKEFDRRCVRVMPETSLGSRARLCSHICCRVIGLAHVRCIAESCLEMPVGYVRP
jgi:hypothetical protein